MSELVSPSALLNSYYQAEFPALPQLPPMPPPAMDRASSSVFMSSGPAHLQPLPPGSSLLPVCPSEVENLSCHVLKQMIDRVDSPALITSSGSSPWPVVGGKGKRKKGQKAIFLAHGTPQQTRGRAKSPMLIPSGRAHQKPLHPGLCCPGDMQCPFSQELQ